MSQMMSSSVFFVQPAVQKHFDVNLCINHLPIMALTPRTWWRVGWCSVDWTHPLIIVMNEWTVMFQLCETHEWTRRPAAYWTLIIDCRWSIKVRFELLLEHLKHHCDITVTSQWCHQTTADYSCLFTRWRRHYPVHYGICSQDVSTVRV